MSLIKFTVLLIVITIFSVSSYEFKQRPFDEDMSKLEKKFKEEGYYDNRYRSRYLGPQIHSKLNRVCISIFIDERYLFSSIFILLSRESDQSAVTSSLGLPAICLPLKR